jgi:hypothetical protein
MWITPLFSSPEVLTLSVCRGAGSPSCPYSPKCVEKLSEKGYDQRSDHEFGWYTEGEMDRKVAFGGPQGYAARVLETFQTVSKKNSRKFAERFEINSSFE